MDGDVGARRHARVRRIWLVFGAVVAATVVLLVVALLAIYQVPPFCSIPGGTSGYECLDGTDYEFETVNGPTEPGVPETVSYSGEVFQLTLGEDNATEWLEINVSDAQGPHGSVELTGPGISANPPTWQTALVPGGGAGAQVRGADISEVRLLVRT